MPCAGLSCPRAKNGSVWRLRGWVRAQDAEGRRGKWRLPAARGLSAGSLREPPRRISWAAGGAQRKGQAANAGRGR